jgi:hypothetical protein
LEIDVRGVSGNLIQLDATKNGVLKITDPTTMLYLGYGFKHPKPGKWVVTLKTTAETPSQGADYALNARFMGGATLTVSSSVTIPAIGQPVTLLARLQSNGTNLTIETAQALIRKPDGAQETLTLSLHGDVYSVEYKPQQSGLHSAEIILTGKSADSFSVDRAAYLTFEVQPADADVLNSRIITLVFAVLFVLVILFFFLRRKRG